MVNIPKAISSYETGDGSVIYFRQNNIGTLRASLCFGGRKYKRIKGEKLVKLNAIHISGFLTKRNFDDNPLLFKYLKECVSWLEDKGEW